MLGLHWWALLEAFHGGSMLEEAVKDSSDSRRKALLLIDHGSRRKEAHSQLVDIGERLEARLLQVRPEPPPIVEIAHMEIAQPSILAAFSTCVERGAEHIVAIPCFLSRGRHVTSDIPHLLQEASAAHPGVSFVLTAPLSEQMGFLDLLLAAADSV